MLGSLGLIIWAVIVIGCFIVFWRTIFRSVKEEKAPTLSELNEVYYPAHLIVEETNRRSRARREKGD